MPNASHGDAEETEMDENDDDDDTEAEEEEGARDEAPPVARPRARAVATPDLPVFGSVPPRVTHWSMRKQNALGQWEICKHATPDGRAELQEWPVAELSVDAVRARWGAGVYRVGWREPTGKGGLTARGSGRTFTLPPDPAPAPPPAPAMSLADALPPGFAQAIAIMNIIDSRANGNIASMAQLASMMRAPGTDPALIQIVQQQGQMLQRLAEGQERLAQQLSARPVERDDDDDDDDDDEPGAAGQVVRAAAPLFRPGKPMTESIKAAIGNYFAENPDKLVDIVKAVPQVLEQVSKLANPPQPAPRARAVLAPQPAVVEPPPMAPPKPPPGPGLNGLVRDQERASKPPVEGPPART